MAEIAAMRPLTAAQKEKKGQRKTDNRNYQRDNRQTWSGGAVPNYANHYEWWEKHGSAAIVVPWVGKLCDISTARQ
jgi:hypothetical protein